jgi:hypothetical protein
MLSQKRTLIHGQQGNHLFMLSQNILTTEGWAFQCEHWSTPKFKVIGKIN